MMKKEMPIICYELPHHYVIFTNKVLNVHAKRAIHDPVIKQT